MLCDPQELHQEAASQTRVGPGQDDDDPEAERYLQTGNIRLRCCWSRRSCSVSNAIVTTRTLSGFKRISLGRGVT